MSNIAVLTFKPAVNKWVATYNGQLVASSPNKDYVVGNIRNGRCTKAVKLNVIDVREVGETVVNDKGVIAKVETFGINERFDFLADFVHMVADRTSPSVVVTGEGGLGKTFTVNEALHTAGLIQTDTTVMELGDDGEVSPPTFDSSEYVVVKGYSSAKGLFRTLYENRNKIIVFDDCDSVLDNTTSLELLKGALDSYDRRIITWNSEAQDGLPKSFEFVGGVIFISNRPIYKVDQAIRSRAICVDLSMTSAQKIERMRVIIKSEKFMPNFSMETKIEALEFLESMKDRANDLNLRSLISTTKVAARGGDWHRKAEYLLTEV